MVKIIIRNNCQILKLSKKIILVLTGIIVFAGVCAYIIPDIKNYRALSFTGSNKGPDVFMQIDTASTLIPDLMKLHPEWFSDILDSLSEYEVQIIYTRIDRDINNKPHCREYCLNLNNNIYFNPASLVKLPVALLSLEKLNKLNVPEINKDCRIRFDSAYDCQLNYTSDTNVLDKIPTISHFIEEMMLVSDNEAYCRLYEFLGQQFLNEQLWSKGFRKALILQRFNNCCYDCNRYTNPVFIYNQSNAIIYRQPMIKNSNNYKNPLGVVKKGRAYYDGHNRYVDRPRDFTYSNNLPLQDIHDILVSLIFPDEVPSNRQFNISRNDRDFILRYMAMYPHESVFPSYQNSELYPDNFKKYFLWGSTGKTISDTNIRSINIVGQSFGYLSDCAYIVDFQNKLEFFLAAVIFTNKDGILCPAHYQYASEGLPFLENLGKTFYAFELSRNRKFRPNLVDMEQNLKTINNNHQSSYVR